MRLLRFRHDEVLSDVDAVVLKIRNAIEKKNLTPDSSPLLPREKGTGDEAKQSEDSLNTSDKENSSVKEGLTPAHFAPRALKL